MTHTPRTIIGISGTKRSGKNAAAEALTDGFSPASFAQKLKDFIYAVNPLIPDRPAAPGVRSVGGFTRLQKIVDELGWEEAKDTYPEVRHLLERTGTEAGRRVLYENVWVDAVMGDLPAGDVVFTDVRFPNEADAIRAAGGFVIRIERPGYEAAPGAHISETALDGYAFDWTIHNVADLPYLHQEVRSAVRRLHRSFTVSASEQAPAHA